MNEMVSIGLGVAYVALGVAVLVIAKLVRDVVTPYKLDDELTNKDNPALGLSLSGYFLGVVIIFLGAVVGPEPESPPTAAEIGLSMLKVLGYTIGGIGLLNAGNLALDRVVLSAFSIHKEIVRDRNLGTGAVAFGSYVATALVVAGSIYGEAVHAWWHGPLSALVFFVLGQAALALFGVLYRWITKYDLHAEIERDNAAAGIAFGLSIVAIGIVLLRATGQDFAAIEAAVGAAKTDALAQMAAAGEPIADELGEQGFVEVGLGEVWAAALVDFGYYALGGFVVLALLRRVTDALLLPGTTIYREIASDRNAAAALIEGSVAIGVASIVYFLI